jgi:hypothetical protein
MIPSRDEQDFAVLIRALDPYLDRIVIVGGWAHRLHRRHPLAQPVPHAPLMTLDADLAIARDIPPADESLHERLAHDFRDEFLGEDHPPVTHYCLRNSASGFYAEFLTPLVGSEVTRAGPRKVTKRILGVSAQTLRHLDVVMVSPWLIPLSLHEASVQVLVANPVSYIVQKLLIHGRRKPDDRAKDVLYIHDTLALFAGTLPELHRLWCDAVRPALELRAQVRVRRAVRELLDDVTDTVREAARMAAGRSVSPGQLRETCRAGLLQILD